MPISLTGFNLKKWKAYADWKLLVLLLLFLDVKIAVKIPAIALIYLWQFDFKFGFRLKNSRLPLFYLLIMILPVAALFINQSYQSLNYLVVFGTGIFFWLLCILAIHQVKLSVDRHDTGTLHRTVLLFFIINAALSAFNLLAIIWETHALNPYLYQGQYQKYFIGTGDYIRGATFDTSTTNAVINAMGVLYFLTRKNAPMLFICMAVLLLTGSNFINIALLLILALLFAFRTDRYQKSLVVICLMFLVVFMAKVSPQNNRYVNETFAAIFEKEHEHHAPPAAEVPLTRQPDSVLNPEQRKEKFARLYLDSLSNAEVLKTVKNQPPPPPAAADKPIIKTDEGRIILPQANIHSATYQSIKVPLKAQHPLLVFIDEHRQFLPFSAGNAPVISLPGKAIGMLQTGKFMAQHPAKILLGNGMGNFSSKLAFRATGLNFAGGFPQRFIYINPAFMTNHLDLYLNFFSKQSGYHSLTNSPFSVYDQLLAEYGLIGLALFVIFYLGFFARHYKTLTYGLPVLGLIMAALFVDYWFEQLSIMIFFELLLLLNIKETTMKLTEGATRG